MPSNVQGPNDLPDAIVHFHIEFQPTPEAIFPFTLNPEPQEEGQLSIILLIFLCPEGGWVDYMRRNVQGSRPFLSLVTWKTRDE